MGLRRGKSEHRSSAARAWQPSPPRPRRQHIRTSAARSRKLALRPKLVRTGTAHGPALDVPGSTYRLQFHSGFTFEDASELVNYLHDLGITHCYASPIFTARSGSGHGYDVCNFAQVNPALGGATTLGDFARKLQEHDMSLLLDIVPNHMAADSSNPWWRDVLENGRHSKYARWFDIDWDRPEPELKGKVLLPILGDAIEREIVAGKIRLAHSDKRFSIQYCDKHLPLSPASAQMLERQLDEMSGAKLLQKYNDGEHPLYLQQLLEKQNYRLAFWRVASEKLNYRRFFDVSELIGLRVELPEVFDAVHQLPLSLIKQGMVTGLRVDHPDGLWDPSGYFERLKAATKPHGSRNGSYVVAEKILTDDERLPRNWAVNGTTGYDFLNKVNGLFVDGAVESEFDELYRKFTGQADDFKEAVRHGKERILSTSLRAEMNQLARRLKRLLEGYECSFEMAVDALREVVVHFPVYRTYITEHSTHPTEAEAAYINQAVAETLAGRPDIDGELLRLIRSVLLLRHPKSRTPRFREFVMRFQQVTGPATAKGVEDTAFYNYNRLISLNEVGGDAGRFGASIRAFHVHNQFVASNWPNTLLATATHDTKRGEDARARINVLSEFVEEWKEALQRWAKLNAEKKIKVGGEAAPSANDEYLFYQTLVGVWPDEQKYSVFSIQYRDSIEELRARLTAYMLKAIKESKAHTSWLAPKPEYEAAVQKFVSETLDEARSAEFLQDFQTFQKQIAFFGYLNSLSQVVLKMTSPGVPDLYQGCELWDFSLVDPDNRQLVDFKLRRRIFGRLKADAEHGMDTLQRLLQNPENGAIKMFVLWRALEARQTYAQLFKKGEYVPVEVKGEQAKHVIAFARRWKKRSVITVVPRLIAGLCKKQTILPLGERIWRDTALVLDRNCSRGRIRNAITGEVLEAKKELALSEILAKSPVAILETTPV